VNLSFLDFRFLLLLVAVGLGRKLLPLRWHLPFGALASIGLVGLFSPSTLIVILAVSFGYLVPARRLIRRAKTRSATAAKHVTIVMAAGLLVMMILFKAHLHFNLPFLQNSLIGPTILSLVGFSYFLFRAANYLYMNYLVDLDEESPLVMPYYLLFPPTLTSGPVHKYVDFRRQATAIEPLDAPVFVEGVYRITRGFFRKVVLAYCLDSCAKELLAFDNWWIGTSVLLVVVLYLFFYFDFAGYSDIAIGFGALLGIRVPENFRRPFLATSVTEFWRHWHITLADWLRDHVFIPLGGMRATRRKGACLGMLIMVLCGLWHGLTLSFVLWGVWHGSMLFAEGVLGSKPLPPARRQGIKYWTRVGWTNARMAFGALFFLPSIGTIGQVLEGFFTLGVG